MKVLIGEKRLATKMIEGVEGIKLALYQILVNGLSD